MKKNFLFGVFSFIFAANIHASPSEASPEFSTLWLDEMKSETLVSKDLYSLTETTTHFSYSNHYAGYQIAVPKDWTIDSSQTSNYTRLFGDTFRVDITFEDLKAIYKTKEEVINESFDTLSTHKTSSNTWITSNGYTVLEEEYKRAKLNSIGNDDLYIYTYFSIEHEGMFYLFQLKTGDATHAEIKSTFKDILNSIAISKPQTNLPLHTHPIVSSSPSITYTENKHSLTIPSNEVVYGIYQPGKASDIYTKESELNTHFGSQMFYKPINSTYDTYVDEIIENNRVPLVTFHFQDSTLTNNERVVLDVIEGKYDNQIRTWAEGIKNTEAPVFVRIANEMNGAWTDWSHKNVFNDPDLYKVAYRHVVDVFRNSNATNVRFVWNPNDIPKPDYSWNDASLYYPGDNYVDWIGMTAYNFGKSEWSDFQYFDDLYSELYEEYMRSFPNKPMMIGEFASVENEGNKPYFIADMFEKIKHDYPNIKLVIWFNQTDGEYIFPYDSTEASFYSFKEGLSTDGNAQYPMTRTLPDGLIAPEPYTKTKNTFWTFTGVATDTKIKHVYLNGEMQLFRWVNWRQFDKTFKLKDGYNEITVTIEFQDGTTQNYPFFVEKKPNFKLSTKASPKVTTAPSVNISTTILTGLVENKNIKSMKINNVETEIKWSWRQFDYPVNLQKGINEFIFTGYDEVGNLLNEERYYIFKNEDEIVVTSPSELKSLHHDLQRTITGMAPSSSITKVLIDGIEQTLKWSWRQFDQNISLDHGDNSFKVDAFYENTLNGEKYYYPIHKTYHIQSPNYKMLNGSSYQPSNAIQIDEDTYEIGGIVKNPDINSIAINGENAELLYDWKQFSHIVDLKPGLNAIEITGYSDDNYKSKISTDTIYVFNGADLIITSPKRDYSTITNSSITLTGMVPSSNISRVRINGEEQTLKWSWKQFDKPIELDTTKDNHITISADYQGYEKGKWYQYEIKKTYILTPDLVSSFDFTTDIGETEETAVITYNNVEYIGALISDKDITRVTVNGNEVPIEYSWRQISVGVPLEFGLNKIEFVGYGGTDNSEVIETTYRYLYLK